MERNTDREKLIKKNEEIRLMQIERESLLRNILKKQKISVANNTYWEELVCVGFNPELGQLEAVVSIKRSTGYSGGLCTDGSTEYVRFFIDWGDGHGFQNVGLTSFKAHNISDVPPGPQHPLHYMVYLPLDDEKFRKCCDIPVLPRVRAILSWNKIPSIDPNQVPYYGNHIDADIQIQPLDTNIRCMLEAGIIKKDSILLESIDLEATIPKLKPKPVPWSKLLSAYKEAEVPDHRLVYEAAYPMLKGGEALSLAAAQMDITKVEELKINIDEVVEILSEAEANVTYEEMVCIGLNTASDILGAVIHVKKPYGYSGNLCQKGSMEYVAFWADWNNDGTYDEYLGTAGVKVHDIPKIRKDGLFYGVLLPANFTEKLKDCKDPNIVRIRAVLSWAVPPSTVNPDDLNYWGNRLDAVVQIRPGKSTEDLMELLYDVGNVPIENISPVTFLANPSVGPLDPTDCSAPNRDRPFGGNVRIGGRIYNTGPPETVHYQVQYAPHGTANWKPVTYTHTFELMHPNPFDPKYPKEIRTVHSADGWFPYLENPLTTPPILERTARFAVWNTGSLEGVYDLRLAYTKDYPITPGSVIHYSLIVTIVLDNTNYTVSPTQNPVVDTAYMLDLVIDGGDCRSYKQGTKIKGHLRALDEHFWKWILELQPTTHTHGTQALPPCRSYGSLLDKGDGNAVWTLDTSKLDKCGYTLTLWAYDRTIVNSNGAVVHWNKKAVGFSVI